MFAWLICTSVTILQFVQHFLLFFFHSSYLCGDTTRQIFIALLFCWYKNHKKTTTNSVGWPLVRKNIIATVVIVANFCVVLLVVVKIVIVALCFACNMPQQQWQLLLQLTFYLKKVCLTRAHSPTLTHTKQLS